MLGLRVWEEDCMHGVGEGTRGARGQGAARPGGARLRHVAGGTASGGARPGDGARARERRATREGA
jgi:hypothetical protein